MSTPKATPHAGFVYQRESEARHAAHEFKGNGYRTRVVYRDVRAGGLKLPCWVVLLTRKED